MAQWLIEDGFLVIDNTRQSDKISTLRNSSKYKIVEVVLCSGAVHSLCLDNFKCSTTYIETFNKKCRVSRTEFMKWAKENLKINCKTTETNVCKDVSIEGKNDGDQSEIQGENQEASSPKIQSVQENEPCVDEIDEDLIPEFIGSFSIQRKLVGKNVLVNIANLIEPRDDRKLRDMNKEHVQKLEKEFRKNCNVFTILIGNIHTTNFEISNLQVAGSCQIEVIGGNHTRQALSNIGRKGCVAMDLYHGLTRYQAIKIGIEHNNIHQFGRSTTFEEKVKLFRNMYKETEKNNPNKSKKYITMQWRSLIAEIMQIDRNKVKNSFQTHLRCATLPESTWLGLESLFDSWKQQKVLKQPSKEMKQTHLSQLYRLCDEEKLNVLNGLCNQELTYLQYKDTCLQRSKTVTDEVECQNAPEEVAVISHTPGEHNRSDVQMHKENASLKRELKSLKETSREEFESLQAIKNSLEKELSKTIEALQRSTTENVQVNELLKESEAKHTESYQKITDLENKNMRLKTQLIKKEKEIEEMSNKIRQTEDVTLRDGGRKRILEQNMPDVQIEKKSRLTETEDSDGDDQEKVTAAVVEYNKKTVYLGILSGEEMTFAYQPIGKLSKNFLKKKSSDQSYIINTDNVMEIDKSYLIYTFETYISCKKLYVSNEEEKCIIEKVLMYIDKN